MDHAGDLIALFSNFFWLFACFFSDLFWLFAFSFDHDWWFEQFCWFFSHAIYEQIVFTPPQSITQMTNMDHDGELNCFDFWPVLIFCIFFWLWMMVSTILHFFNRILNFWFYFWWVFRNLFFDWIFWPTLSQQFEFHFSIFFSIIFELLIIIFIDRFYPPVQETK